VRVRGRVAYPDWLPAWLMIVLGHGVLLSLTHKTLFRRLAKPWARRCHGSWRLRGHDQALYFECGADGARRSGSGCNAAEPRLCPFRASTLAAAPRGHRRGRVGDCRYGSEDSCHQPGRTAAVRASTRRRSTHRAIAATSSTLRQISRC